MDKIAIGVGYPEDLVDLDATPAENLNALAVAKGVRVPELTACVLDRPRHGKLIEDIRSAGAALRLIGDGDIAGVIHVAEPLETGIDMYLGLGGAPKGELAAAALACIGGQMQGRLVAANEEQRARAHCRTVRSETQIHAFRDGLRRPQFCRDGHYRRLIGGWCPLRQTVNLYGECGDAGFDPDRALDQERTR